MWTLNQFNLTQQKNNVTNSVNVIIQTSLCGDVVQVY